MNEFFRTSQVMIEIKTPRDQMRLRRMVLAAQGLLQTRAYGRGLSAARKAIEHIGYVQIDTISVVERAHHHVLYTRVPDFQPEMMQRMLADSDIFEYWAHAAAFLPMSDFRFSLPYKHAIKSGQTHWYRQPDQKLMKELLARIRSDGPIRSRDVDNERSAKSSGWWDWKPAKKALEQLYMQGDLMVCKREGFQKSYDLTERVLPAYVNTQMPDLKEFAHHLIDQQLRCHGLVSLKGLTYLRRTDGLREMVKTLVNECVAQRDLEPVRLKQGDVFFIKTGALEQSLPRVNRRLSILSPFDNSVIQRERLSALFQYDYQLECYVPEAKRQYGYFCLPLLFGDQFIGRMDCKAHRKIGLLEVKALHLEREDFDEEAFFEAFAEEIQNFAQFQNCASVTFKNVFPHRFASRLNDDFASL